MSLKDCLERITCSQYFLFHCQPFILMAALFLILSFCSLVFNNNFAPQFIVSPSFDPGA